MIRSILAATCPTTHSPQRPKPLPSSKPMPVQPSISLPQHLHFQCRVCTRGQSQQMPRCLLLRTQPSLSRSARRARGRPRSASPLLLTSCLTPHVRLVVEARPPDPGTYPFPRVAPLGSLRDPATMPCFPSNWTVALLLARKTPLSLLRTKSVWRLSDLLATRIASGVWKNTSVKPRQMLSRSCSCTKVPRTTRPPPIRTTHSMLAQPSRGTVLGRTRPPIIQIILARSTTILLL
jgi:hypothetical protein